MGQGGRDWVFWMPTGSLSSPSPGQGMETFRGTLWASVLGLGFLLEEQGTCVKTILMAWNVTAALQGNWIPMSAVCMTLTELAHHEMLFMWTDGGLIPQGQTGQMWICGCWAGEDGLGCCPGLKLLFWGMELQVRRHCWLPSTWNLQRVRHPSKG